MAEKNARTLSCRRFNGACRAIDSLQEGEIVTSLHNEMKKELKKAYLDVIGKNELYMNTFESDDHDACEECEKYIDEVADIYFSSLSELSKLKSNMQISSSNDASTKVKVESLELTNDASTKVKVESLELTKFDGNIREFPHGNVDSLQNSEIIMGTKPVLY